MTKAIPISVIVVTRNEAERLPKCLDALKAFDQVIVVDSMSDDGSDTIAKAHGATFIQFEWNGRYPKKRQWCLDNMGHLLDHNWVFFVDADEIVTPELITELQAMDWREDSRTAGYFVKGQYIFKGKPIRFGMVNNKLCLFHRHKMAFPVVDDLDIPGMGEIEGHYQPVLKDIIIEGDIGQIKTPLLHDAFADEAGWHERHERYAKWERAMDERDAWPMEDTLRRNHLKRWFRSLPDVSKAWAVFLYSYIIRAGFLDGLNGFYFAKMRADYYANR